MTALDVTFLSKAQLSLKEQSDFYRRVSASDLHVRWRKSIDEALSSLMLCPQGGAMLGLTNTDVAHLRRWPVPGFSKHLLIYAYDSAERRVTLVDVVHGARDLPTYLRDLRSKNDEDDLSVDDE